MMKVPVKIKGEIYEGYEIDEEGVVTLNGKKLVRSVNSYRFKTEDGQIAVTIKSLLLESFTGIIIPPRQLKFVGKENIRNIRRTGKNSIDIIEKIFELLGEDVPIEDIYRSDKNVKFPETPYKISDRDKNLLVTDFNRMDYDGRLYEEVKKFMIYYGWADERLLNMEEYKPLFIAQYMASWNEQLDKMRNPKFIINLNYRYKDTFERSLTGLFYEISDSRNRVVKMGTKIVTDTMMRALLEKKPNSDSYHLKGFPGISATFDESFDGLQSMVKLYKKLYLN